MGGVGTTQEPEENLTVLLSRFNEGDPGEDVGAAVEAELRRIAARYGRRTGGSETLKTTALVNQSWLKLARAEKPEWSDRHHFRAFASMVVRNLVVDYARGKKARGMRMEVGEGTAVAAGEARIDVLDIDMALRELAEFAPRQAELVELRFFGGLSLEDCAAELGIAARTADKDWAMARAWLRRRLAGLGR